MASARRRGGGWRPRRIGLFWQLLGIAGLALVFGAMAVLWSRRRGFSLDDLEDDFGPPPGHPPGHPIEPTEETAPAPERPEDSVSDVAVWIAGPAGNLLVRDGGPEDASGLPVLFVHSLGGNGGQWALQLDHLRRTRRAVALDLRGHGDSDPAEDGDYSIEALAGDVAAVADQLALRRFVLAGHSLGGSVAIEYAGRHPERVAALLLVDPNGDQSQIPRAQAESFVRSIAADPHAEMEWHFRQILAHGEPSASRWVLEDLHKTDEAALMGGFESSFKHRPLPALARFGGPKLTVVSDMNTLPYSLHKLVPDLRMRLVAGTGHWLQMDRPGVVNDLLDELIAEAEGAR
jgi:pimeloyl-ACP methyl ester carboxylesterase